MTVRRVGGLGERMKSYEAVWSARLMPRTPAIVRVDGRAFHTFTRGYEKPWDQHIQDGMTRLARALVDEIQGARLAYVQSDEVSVLLVDYDRFGTEAWFGGDIAKVVSCSASEATRAYGEGALFDSRAFSIPREEVVNYFIWRQRDATRNSIQGLGRAHFSHKQLHGKSTSDVQDMLMQDKGVNWNDCRTRDKRGWCVLEGDLVDYEPPIFSRDRDYIQRLVDRVSDGAPESQPPDDAPPDSE